MNVDYKILQGWTFFLILNLKLKNLEFHKIILFHVQSKIPQKVYVNSDVLSVEIVLSVYLMRYSVTVTLAKKPTYQRLVKTAQSIKIQQTFHRSLYEARQTAKNRRWKLSVPVHQPPVDVQRERLSVGQNACSLQIVEGIEIARECVRDEWGVRNDVQVEESTNRR